MEIKICNTCNKQKSILDFELGTNKYKGRVSTYRYNKCKDCDRERINAKNRRTKSRHRQQNIEYQKQFAANNPDYIKKYKKEYYQLNKDKIKARIKKYTYSRRENDPIFRLKESISASIRGAITKNNRSTFKILPYTVQELKEHIEKQFESWMTWENYGTYRIDIWNDDKATWTWQVDHIVPHSYFKYKSIEDKEFRECWALDNLRPYSAKQNVIDGDR